MGRISDFFFATFGNTIEFDAAPDNAQALMAAVALLAAQSDGSISANESAQLERLIADKYANSDEESVQRAADLAERIPDFSNWEALLKTADKVLSSAQKEDLMVMVLHIIAADGRKAPGELALLDELVDGLGMPEKAMDSVYARYFADRR